MKAKFIRSKNLKVEHELKIDSWHLGMILNGRKKFEVRVNDRGFQEGDRVVLVENTGMWEPRRAAYTIGHMTRYQQKEGYVVWSIEGLEFPR